MSARFGGRSIVVNLADLQCVLVYLLSPREIYKLRVCYARAPGRSNGAGGAGLQPEADTAEVSKYKLLWCTRALSHSLSFSFSVHSALLGEATTSQLDRPNRPPCLSVPPDSSSSPTATGEPNLATGSDFTDDSRRVSSPLTPV